MSFIETEGDSKCGSGEEIRSNQLTHNGSDAHRDVQMI